MSANEGNGEFTGQTPVPLLCTAIYIGHMSEKRGLRATRSGNASWSMYRSLERLLELSWMFEDMIDTLLGAHRKLWLLVGAAQDRVSIE